MVSSSQGTFVVLKEAKQHFIYANLLTSYVQQHIRDAVLCNHIFKSRRNGANAALNLKSFYFLRMYFMFVNFICSRRNHETRRRYLQFLMGHFLKKAPICCTLYGHLRVDVTTTWSLFSDKLLYHVSRIISQREPCMYDDSPKLAISYKGQYETMSLCFIAIMHTHTHAHTYTYTTHSSILTHALKLGKRQRHGKWDS